jgi:hypothetical protein
MGFCLRQQNKKLLCFFEKVRNFLADRLDA